MNRSRAEGRYTSPRRNQQAQDTRHAIVEAAGRLFIERGYAGTTIEAVAREANVAVQTVYASIGGKKAVLRAINDVVDEQAGLPEILAQIAAATQPQDLIRLTVRLTRQFAERKGAFFAVLQTVASNEPDLNEILVESRRRHREGTERVAGRLGAMGGLRPDVSLERAGQVLGVLTWLDTYASLVREYRFSYDEAEQWIIVGLETLLL